MTRRNSTRTPSFDAVIAGGGPAGLTMAALLGAAGLSALVIERESRARLAAPAYDGRTIALAYGSKLAFESCGVWEALAPAAGPIDAIDVRDQRAPQILNFLAKDIGDHPFGYVVDNHLLRAELFARVTAMPSIRLSPETALSRIAQRNGYVSVSTDAGDTYNARLLIAADGRQSFCRRQTGIRTRNWDYNETALVATVAHSRPHHNTATENFFPGGPFAILPMSGGRSGIVWTEKPQPAQTLLEMDESLFLSLLGERSGGRLGELSLASPRKIYPLRFMLADELWKDRTVLIGEAAHGMHPIAGQGFNLSVRDCAALAELMAAAKERGDDCGNAALLSRYAGLRHPDHLTFMTATDALVKLFSTRFPPLRWARQLGLGLVQQLPPAKRFFSRIATGLPNQNHS